MAKTFEEIGDSGLVRWYGQVETRYIKDLYGEDGINTFEEMFRRDPTLRSFLYAVKLMARTATWRSVAASDGPADREAAEFLDSCLADMSHTITDAIDNILSMLPHGWSWLELCYKRRTGSAGKNASQFDDGRIGWRKWAPRKQTSWYKWEFDEAGGVSGMWQWPQGERRAGKAILLPIEKSLHFKTEPAQGDPEGVSLAEGCYEHWYFLKNILPIQGIGFERSFVGLPVFKYRELAKPDSTDKAAIADMGKGLRMGEKAYAVIPGIIEDFYLASSDNPVAGSLLDTIQYYRRLMLQSVLTEFLALGVSSTGSFAAHRDKTDLFLMAVDGFLGVIEAIINRFAVPRLFGYNEFAGITALPTVQHAAPKKPDLQELGQFVQAIAPYIPLQDEDVLWVRDKAGMPEIEEEAEEEAPEPEAGETGDELAGVGRALAEFAEAADPGPLLGRVAQALQARWRALLEALGDSPEMPEREYWDEEQRELRQGILPGMEQVALEGAQVAVAELEALGLMLDWTLVNQAAADWARQYTFELVKGITKTSRKALQTQLANWIESGEALPDLARRLETIYGPVRAEMIAVTEATRAYAEGNTKTWGISDVVEARRWNTANDDDVCRICAPLNGEVRKLGEAFTGGIENPPAHPRCRCWVTPVIVEG